MDGVNLSSIDFWSVNNPFNEISATDSIAAWEADLAWKVISVIGAVAFAMLGVGLFSTYLFRWSIEQMTEKPLKGTAVVQQWKETELNEKIRQDQLKGKDATERLLQQAQINEDPHAQSAARDVLQAAGCQKIEDATLQVQFDQMDWTDQECLITNEILDKTNAVMVNCGHLFLAFYIAEHCKTQSDYGCPECLKRITSLTTATGTFAPPPAST